MPSFGGLFGDDDDEDAIKQIESTVASAGRNGDGGWTISLADKTVWTQTDDAMLGLSPKTGEKVVVKRGALGSYYLSVNGQPGIKVKRIWLDIPGAPLGLQAGGGVGIGFLPLDRPIAQLVQRDDRAGNRAADMVARASMRNVPSR